MTPLRVAAPVTVVAPATPRVPAMAMLPGASATVNLLRKGGFHGEAPVQGCGLGDRDRPGNHGVPGAVGHGAASGLALLTGTGRSN